MTRKSLMEDSTMRARPIFALLFLAPASNLALAQTAGMLSFQGLLKDTGGNPINESVSPEFRIFDAETLENLVDVEECQPSELDVGGVGILDGLRWWPTEILAASNSPGSAAKTRMWFRYRR